MNLHSNPKLFFTLTVWRKLKGPPQSIQRCPKLWLPVCSFKCHSVGFMNGAPGFHFCSMFQVLGRKGKAEVCPSLKASSQSQQQTLAADIRAAEMNTSNLLHDLEKARTPSLTALHSSEFGLLCASNRRLEVSHTHTHTQPSACENLCVWTLFNEQISHTRQDFIQTERTKIDLKIQTNLLLVLFSASEHFNEHTNEEVQRLRAAVRWGRLRERAEERNLRGGARLDQGARVQVSFRAIREGKCTVYRRVWSSAFRKKQQFFGDLRWYFQAGMFFIFI